MEQLQKVMAHLLRHRFWYATGVVALALLVNWYLLNDSLSAARAQGTSKIKGKIGEINSVLNVSVESPPGAGGSGGSVKVHPNEATQTGMAGEIDRASALVIEAWRARREAQDRLLQWPADVIASERFVERFRQYDPPEKFPGIAIDSESQNFLTLYKNRIPRRMLAICEKINTRWAFPNLTAESTSASASTAPAGPESDPGNPGDGAGDGEQDPERGDGAGAAGDPAGGDPAPGAEDPGPAPGSGGAAGNAADPGNGEVKPSLPETVRWNVNNQNLWRSKLVAFRGRDGCQTDYPTPYQVLALQQDLWLLEALFDVIATVNGTRPGEPPVVNDLASVKEIEHVVFGREARSHLGRLITPDLRMAGAGAQATQPGVIGGGPEVPSGPGAEAAAAAAAFNPKPPPELILLSPFHGRYVDAKYEPIPVDAVHAALAGPVPPPDRLELIVAKRVPFRLSVKMKESAIPAFIAACSNSAFEFEIVQVRVNRFKSGEKFELGGSSITPGNPFGAPRPGSSGTEGDANFAPETRTNDDVNVEFKGVVRIYNPVDEARIKLVANNQPGV